MFPKIVFFTTFCTLAVMAGDNPLAGWKSLQSLEGEWVSKDGKTTVTYAVVSGGSVVMERMRMPSPQPDMITMYHQDGKTLVATHYCSMGNQPRMRATGGDEKTIRFRFADITNLQKPGGGHIKDLTVTFQDKDHITQEWTSVENGKEQVETFQWTRKQ